MDATESELWQCWQAQRSSELRDRLLLYYLPWARMLARDVFLRIRMRGADWSDYVQNASIGLCEAIDRFDPDRGIAFRSYARHRVRGAVFNGLRVYADGPAPPDCEAGHAKAYGDRARSYSDEPTDDPLTDLIDATVGLGLGYLLDGESMPAPDESSTAYGSIERAEMTNALNQLLQVLPERERLIITLHYLQQVPFVTIAAQLGVTKGRVSQLHRRAMGRLRDAMRQHAALNEAV